MTHTRSRALLLAMVTVVTAVVIYCSAGRQAAPHLVFTQTCSARVEAIAFALQDGLLAIGSQDGQVLLVDPGTGRPLKELHLAGAEVQSLCFSPNGKVLAVAVWIENSGREADRGPWIYLLSVPGGGRVCRLPSDLMISALGFSDDGKTLVVSGSLDKGERAELFNLRDRRRIGAWNAVRVLGLGRHERALLERTPGELVLLDLRAGRVLARRTDMDTLMTIWAASDDGRWLAGGQCNSLAPPTSLQVWDVRARQEAWHDGGVSSICSLTFSSDGSLLADGADGGTLRLWNVARGRQRARLALPAGPVQCVAFSGDNQYLAAAGDRIARVWRIR